MPYAYGAIILTATYVPKNDVYRFSCRTMTEATDICQTILTKTATETKDWKFDWDVDC